MDINNSAPNLPDGSISPQETVPTSNRDSRWLIPGSIVAAGLVIAGAILYSQGLPVKNTQPSSTNETSNQPQIVDSTLSNGAFENITDSDHILGDPNAPVKIVEYSDLECPYCKQFHQTMHQIVNDFSKDGRVVWVYRHFPLEQLHPKALHESEAAECAAELGGNSKFWAYIDRIFEITPSNNGLDANELPKIAEYIGLDKNKFEQCLASGKYKDAILASVQDAIRAGAQGTPYSIILAKDGRQLEINGAQPYEIVKDMVQDALEER